MVKFVAFKKADWLVAVGCLAVLLITGFLAAFLTAGFLAVFLAGRVMGMGSWGLWLGVLCPAIDGR